MRAVDPIASGYATNPMDGVRVAYEVFGTENAPRTMVFLPTWALVHSRNWKMQIPYFASRDFRVVSFDGRGNGKSDRPANGYTIEHYVGDTLAVFDALKIEQAVVVCTSAGGYWGTYFTADHPERVSHLILVVPSTRLDDTPPDRTSFLAEPPNREGENKFNAVHWRENLPDFIEWFMHGVFNEPHSTKQTEDFISYTESMTPDILTTSILEMNPTRMATSAAAVTCPTLIVHGTDDVPAPFQLGENLHQAIGHSKLVAIDGGGHGPGARHPVKTNLTFHEFIGREPPPVRHWRRAMARATKRALFVSSPIGLGHAQRDVAIARELRALIPNLEIDWLAQHPVTLVLAANGERIHPFSDRLVAESLHMETESGGEHELNVFQALRTMDEILLNNFHVFLDAASEGDYDLWIGDEAWEVDYYLHENPELKTAPFAWLTDFVGYLPMVGGPEDREAFLTADYNAEMIEQVARFPRVRDLSLFFGTADDIVLDHFGPDLPSIRDWVSEHFEFTGYVQDFDPECLGDRTTLRQRLGFGPDERVAVAAVGGTGVGRSLLQRIVESFPAAARELLPGLRLVAVCGPRIDPASMPVVPGVEYLGYVQNLYEMLAAADVALVQGGLSTTMELVATDTPFLYFPLTNHFEQNRHVVHRLERYAVPPWARVPFSDATPHCIADRLVKLVCNPPHYREVETGGGRRAAERLATLL